MAKGKGSTGEFEASGWIDPDKVGLVTMYLDLLKREDVLRDTDLRFNIQVGGPVEDAKVKIMTTLMKTMNGHRPRIREKALEAYEKVAIEVLKERNGEDTTNGHKNATAALKSLNDYVNNFFKRLPREVRSVVAKELDCDADDLYTLLDLDFGDVDLRLGLFANEAAESDAENESEQNKKLKETLKSTKKKWRVCYIVWRNPENVRVVVDRPKKASKAADLKEIGDSMDAAGANVRAKGRVYVDGSNLNFEFKKKKAQGEGGKLPSPPEKRIKEALKKQLDKDYKVVVEFVEEYSWDEAEELEEKKAEEKKSAESKPKGKPQSTGKGKLADPKAKRQK